MKPQNAAALVAAGMLSVLIYPLVGLRWLEKGSKATGRPTAPCTRCTGSVRPSGRPVTSVRASSDRADRRIGLAELRCRSRR